MARPRTWARRIARWGIALLVLTLLAAVAWVFAIGWRPSDKDYQFQGIDVSEASGPIDWMTVHGADTGADFAYIRATYGADGRDTRFAQNWSDAYAADIRRGALHVYSLCRLAVDQANNFNTVVPEADDALPAAVSVDFSDDCPDRPERAVLVGEIERFMTMVEAHTGKPMLLMTTKRIEAAYRLSEAIPRPIWSVQDFFPPDYAARPWRMWRASDMRRVQGIQGAVHWDVVAR
jgi:lysozyme